MPKEKMFKWTVEFSISETWVADGFELTDDRALDMLFNEFRYLAYVESELGAKIIKSPSRKAIRKAQGYKD